jgi:hypothetical protein
MHRSNSRALRHRCWEMSKLKVTTSGSKRAANIEGRKLKENCQEVLQALEFLMSFGQLLIVRIVSRSL